MNKIIKQFFVFIVLILSIGYFMIYSINNKVAYAEKEEDFNIEFNFLEKIENKKLTIREDAKKYVCDGKCLSSEKLSLFLKRAYKKGIMPVYALEFCFEDFSKIITDLIAQINLKEKDAKLVAIKNTGNIKLENAILGREVNKNCLIFDIFNNLVNKNDKIAVKYCSIKPEICDEFFNDIKNVRGHFYTTYISSSPERKNNIELALSKFDGLTINPGEVLSFNQITGQRSEENGYLSAKIISGGEFIDGFGGGVCQASTTLYNACLVSGLEILEANQHSLKVNYIAPSFDAMVNYGSSDLKIKNNTDAPITFATRCDGSRCEVFVYGAKNNYEIKRRSEIISEKPPESEEVIESNNNEDDFNDAGYYYKTYPKNEVISEGFLEYYKNGILEKIIKIRHNKYNGVKGVKIVKNEEI